MTQLSNPILAECTQSYYSARTATADFIRLLYQVREENAWEGHFESFSAYLDELGVNRSAASRYLASYQHFAIEGGVAQAKLAAVEPEKLYQAMKLKGSHAQQYSKALTLSRAELKDELSEDIAGVHEHHLGTARWGKCETCDSFLLDHP